MQANIKDPQFNVQWFKQFTIVLNALDNLEARRHVNAMCLAADIPLVESGTQGYLGQAYVIKKDETECFDCQPKPTPTTYPVCTIRSTPSAPIHCIVWAKSFLFSQLFGNSEDEDVLEADDSEENANELAALARETEELKNIKAAAGSPDYAKKVFDKVFNVDIHRLLSMESMWNNRAKPTPLSYEALEESLKESAKNEQHEVQGLPDQKIWDLSENFLVFKDSVVKLANRLLEEKKNDQDAILSFDKDDEDAMNFVTATSNLRAHIFAIPTKSLFDVKSMAGNIIPAIATTNAVIAGVAIMKALGVLRGNIKNNKRIYLTSESRLVQEANSEPNPECGVCRSRIVTVSVNFQKATLNDLIQQVILPSSENGGAGMTEDEVAIMDGNRMIYDIEYDENKMLPLKEIQLKPGTILRVTQDDGDDVDIILEAIDSGDKILHLLNPVPARKPNLKRKNSEEEDNTAHKKTKISIQESDDNIVILEEEEDLVLLD
ncbi:hypothetical protein G6F57_001073 [Rhizopus arrhizus]|uniref:Ubiquitin-activating enzyme E1-like n=1 Tax=Rhizopus oryzae TaxID=64495 RepID=A0A9P6XJM1_RHIOR|nr:hypothetical protein G6F23_004626 [Rhizopus arrhizus]KAG1426878.1 hypothetical protein G6F58_001286 [Rhizopus delemar]KAG0766634.1 hypothetical protein G6F24_003450 [Rhizopus arrhizus]KAG0792538.1 hypothetical protein G6F22_005835 [Rhizopus arrhizus]KAG0797778.1 hypothetical protein G6F21_000266 [Rhizopus arrhizus]